MTNSTDFLADYRALDLEALLESSRYVSAYRATEPLWSQPELAQTLEADEVVLAARFASQLGGDMLARWLMRNGRQRFPDHEGLLLYNEFYGTSIVHPLDRLRALDAQEKTRRFEDPTLQMYWLGAAAMYWGSMRDLNRAHRLLEAADALDTQSSYITMTRANVYLMEDRWDDALTAAEAAWAQSPGRPSCGNTLGRILARSGRVEEAAQCLLEAAERGESYELAVEAARYAMSMAEASEDIRSSEWLEHAHRISLDLPDLAPLRDRYTRRLLDYVRFDVAQARQDMDTLATLAEGGATPYLRNLAGELVEATDRRVRTVPIVPLRQKHNTCLPTAIASILAGKGDFIDVDELVRKVSYAGTESWRAVDWLEQRGNVAIPVILTTPIVTNLIEAGRPLIFIMANLENAHAMTAFGIDYGAKCLLVHDPAGLRWARYDLDRFADIEEPLGPEGIVITTPEDRDAIRALIPNENLEVAHLHLKYYKRLESGGTASAQQILERLEKDYPDHPVTTFVAALQWRNLGQSHRAMEGLQQLLEQYPRCERLQGAVMSVYDASGEATKQCAALEEIIEGAKLPGIQRDQEWRRPPSSFVLQYAQLLSRSDDKLPKARRLLRRTVASNPYSARGYFGIGLMLYRSGDLESAVLPAHIAAHLELEDDQFARFLVQLLSSIHRESEGFDFLRKRAERLSTGDRGAEAWTTLVDAYVTGGYPEKAIAELEEALSRHAKNEGLLAFSVQFWSDAGHWDRAFGALKALKESGHRQLYLQAGARYYARRGERNRAREFADAWLREAPLSQEARQLVVNQTVMESGNAAGVDLIKGWMEGQPENETLEYMLLDLYGKLEDKQAIDALIDGSIARNADDAWAWRERAIRLIDRIALLPADGRTAHAEALDEALRACERTCPDVAATCYIRARCASLQGKLTESLDWYIEAIDRDPYMLGNGGEILALLRGCPKEEREPALQRIEQILMKSAGPLVGTSDLAALWAELFGLDAAKAAVARWGSHRGHDARLVNTKAQLLLDYGEGTSDAREARAILEDAVTKFPSRPELQYTLARCLNALGETEGNKAALRTLIRQSPTDLRPPIRLAQMLSTQGQEEEARSLLEACIAINPIDIIAREAHARHLWEHVSPEKSTAALEAALQLVPESIFLREQLINQYMNLDNHAQSLRCVKEGLDRFPKGAYLWYLYGYVLQRSNKQWDPGAVEQAYRKALELNATQEDAGDALAVLLCELARYQDARDVVNTQRALVHNAIPLRGRLAWIWYEQGERGRAIADMYQVVQDDPRYLWGWRILIGWLAEEGDPKRAQQMLPAVHAGLPDEPFLRGMALDTLSRLNGNNDSSAAAWNQLLADFPQDDSLYMLRIDLLIDWKRYDDARALLNQIVAIHPTSTFLRARDAQLAAAEGDVVRAVEAAQTVWTHPMPDNAWPEQAAWEALENAGMAEEAIEVMNATINTGTPVGTMGVAQMCGYIGQRTNDLWGKPWFWRGDHFPILSVWLPGKSGRRLIDLLDRLDTVPWPADEHRANVLRCLLDMGYGKLAYAWCTKNRNRVDASPELWDIMGLLYLRRWPRKRDLRKFFFDWKKRPGVQLRNASLYVFSIQGDRMTRTRKDSYWRELGDHAREGLERLNHDFTVRYLASMLAMSFLQRRQWDDFLAAVDHYGHYIHDNDNKEHYFMPPEMAAIPDTLKSFEVLLRLENANAESLAEVTDQATACHACPNWVTSAWQQCIAERYPHLEFRPPWSWRIRGMLPI